MMRRATLAASLLALAAIAEPSRAEEPAQTLEALLEDARADQEKEVNLEREREDRFLRERERRETMLAEAQAKLATTRARHAELTAERDRREVELAERRDALAQRSELLDDLFVVVREEAADSTRSFKESLISAEIPGRAGMALRLADRRELPTGASIRKFWQALLAEMVATGQVATFETRIVAPDGAERRAEVLRVGGFTAVSGGRFLRYSPETEKLLDLPRQPPARFRRAAAELEDAAPGAFIAAAIDPSRGAYLSLLTRTPSLRERIAQGGGIAIAILALGAAGIGVALERLVALVLVTTRVRRQEQSPAEPHDDNPLGRILRIGRERGGTDAEALLLRLEEGVQHEVPKLHRGLGLIAVIATSAPLLGLLGTVTGMIEAFQSIALFGTGDPRLMSSGISEALVTTALGLVVAVPLSLFHALLSSRSTDVIRTLDEHCTNLVAGRVEGRDG